MVDRGNGIVREVFSFGAQRAAAGSRGAVFSKGAYSARVARRRLNRGRVGSSFALRAVHAPSLVLECSNATLHTVYPPGLVLVFSRLTVGAEAQIIAPPLRFVGIFAGGAILTSSAVAAVDLPARTVYGGHC